MDSAATTLVVDDRRFPEWPLPPLRVFDCLLLLHLLTLRNAGDSKGGGGDARLDALIVHTQLIG
jgi:hypothetical protein